MIKKLQNIKYRFDRWRVLRSLAGTRLLAELVVANPALTFVQVGANDGQMMDPIHQSILRSQWRGWVIEPVPQLFSELEKNYESLSGRVYAINVAIADQSGPQSFYYLVDREGLPALPGWARGLGSFRRDVIVGHEDRLADLPRYLCEIQVPCLDWRSFCECHGIDELDLLVVDTEGYDYQIIRQLDFAAMRPVVLVYEHHHFDEGTEQACAQLLKEAGYELFKEGLDTWAIDYHRNDDRYQRLLKRFPGWVKRSPYAHFR